MLMRIELQVARCWADSLDFAHATGTPRDVPFGEIAWYESMRTIRNLKRGAAERPAQKEARR
jgi:hypothetical protein